MYHSGFSRETELVGHVYKYEYVCVYIYMHFFSEIYFKELVYMISEAGKSEIHRAGGRLETQAGFLSCSLEV